MDGSWRSFLLESVSAGSSLPGPQEWVYEELRRAQEWWKMQEAVSKLRFCRESSTCPQFLVEIVSMPIYR